VNNFNKKEKPTKYTKFETFTLTQKNIVGPEKDLKSVNRENSGIPV